MDEDQIGSTTQTSVAAPASALTFLFTDVEGSTPLWERHEALMQQTTARHDALLDAIIAQHYGRRVKERGEGDSIFAIFADPADAVAAALAINQAVLAEPWPPETPIKVRMSLHTGIAHFRDGDYYGTIVNQCARIRSLAYGGQILLSGVTAVLVRRTMPSGAGLRSLGLHALKGLSDPEEVFQLTHPDLPREFPPPPSPQAPRHNLPLALTSLIGRESAQAEVLALLGTERLVTLIGTGGVGKTRLALAVAAEVVDQYRDGVWQVELANLTDPGLVPGVLAQVLGLHEGLGRSVLAALQDHLKDKQILLLLDNCEHLLEASATLVGALLRVAPGLRVLATSREALEVAGEVLYRVPSLTVPDPRHLPPLDLVGSYEAVRLFVARVQARRRDFALDERNAAAVAMICARLDGIPLALELAAAQAASLPIEAIAARLDQSIQLLTRGSRDAPARHQTLRATLDWSWDLLSDPERALLQRLAVFAGGWTLGAAEETCAIGQTEEAGEVLNRLAALESKSLLFLAAQEHGESRYRLLEPVRQYAAERLLAAGEDATLRARHLAWCLSLAQAAARHLQGPDQVTWLGLLEVEHDNARAALGWSLRVAGAAGKGLQLATALWRFWELRGQWSEGQRWLTEALALAGAGDTPASLRAHALEAIGALAWHQADNARAGALLEESVALFRGLGDTAGIARSQLFLGIVAAYQGDSTRATALLEESLSFFRELGDTWGMARSLNNLGIVANSRRDQRAPALFEECLALSRESGDTRSIQMALHNLGYLAHRQGDHQRAGRLLQESLSLSRELGDKRGIARSLHNLGIVELERGDYARALALSQECLALFRELGDKRGILISLLTLKVMSARQGSTSTAGTDFTWNLALDRECRSLCRELGLDERIPNMDIEIPIQGDYVRAGVQGVGDLGNGGLTAGREPGMEGSVASLLTAAERSLLEDPILGVLVFEAGQPGELD
jgi:predicted ATPase/class 3 adenylate cyclase